MNHDNLPPVLPLYTLEQPLLLPGTVVPFALTEPGERAMVEDALEGDRYLAIVQPLEAEAPAARAQQEGRPAIYSVGCVAYIGEWHETEPDRYLVLAGGVTRFRIVGEAPCDRGYRRVMVDYEEFRDDAGQIELELEFPACATWCASASRPTTRTSTCRSWRAWRARRSSPPSPTPSPSPPPSGRC